MEVNRLVENEQLRQTEKFGSQINRTDLEWFAITSEEFGETAREVNDLYFTNTDGAEERMVTEAIQTMACLKSWLEQRELRKLLEQQIEMVNT